MYVYTHVDFVNIARLEEDCEPVSECERERGGDGRKKARARETEIEPEGERDRDRESLRRLSLPDMYIDWPARFFHCLTYIILRASRLSGSLISALLAAVLLPSRRD